MLPQLTVEDTPEIMTKGYKRYRMVVLGAAISDRPELLTKMDPVLREFFLFLCRTGVISSFHTQMRSYLSSLKQVGV